MFGAVRAGFGWMFPALVLALGHQAEEVQGIESSLNCQTDYVSKIDCQWTENNGTKYYIPMDLHYQKCSRTCNSSQHICKRTGQPKTISNSTSHCTIKDANFAVAIKYLFIFEPRKPTILRKSFTLLGNIKLQAPFGLNVTVTEEGDYVLSWKTGYAENSSNKLLGTLQYEVNYKQTWEPWENSVSETITGDSHQLEINSSTLGAAGTYIARVRAKPQHCDRRCLWSAWSSETQWEVTRIELVSQAAEAKVMPQNLQCVYDGIQIACTWEVTRESGKYFTFNLHYRKGKDKKIQECKPSEVLHTYPHLTVHSCNIPVRDWKVLENYEGLLELVRPSKIFKPFQNIKPNAPYNLTYKKLADARFQLEWDVINTLYSLEYEINYKKADQSWEDTKVKMIPQSTKTFILPKNSLKPSSTYTVRVRAKVICEPNDPNCYRGSWSEWSPTVHLDTDPDVEIPIIAVCVLIMLCIIFVPVTITVIKRKKRLWLESIPDPAKSRLFHAARQKCPLTTVGDATLEEDNICKLVSAEWSDTLPQITPRKNAEHPLRGDKQRQSSPPAVINDTNQEKGYQSLRLGTEASSFSAPECPDPLASSSEPANYNGPYLFNFQDVSSILSTLSELKAASCKNVSYFQREPEAPGYVKLPHVPCEGISAMDQCKPQPTPSWTPAPETPGVPDYYLHTDDQARGSSGQAPFQHVAGSTFSCAMSTPLTNAAPASSPEVSSGYVQAKVTDNSTDPVSGSGAAVPPSTLSSHGMLFEHEVRNAHPTACSGYVLSPPGEEEVRLAIAPALSNSTEPHSLSADPQQGTRLQPFTPTVDAGPAPEAPAPSKHQVDPQMPTVKKPDPPPTNAANDEAPDVILYQQGAKPILFQQLGDYCFLPGSNSTMKSGCTKYNPSPPSINFEPATQRADFQGKAFPLQPPLSREPVASKVG